MNAKMRKHARSKCVFAPLLRAGFCIYKSILSAYLTEIEQSAFAI
jgi:hypothetical protein